MTNIDPHQVQPSNYWRPAEHRPRPLGARLRSASEALAVLAGLVALLCYVLR